MNAIAAGLRDHVYHAARGAAELGLGVMPDQLELLHRVYVRDHDV